MYPELFTLSGVTLLYAIAAIAAIAIIWSAWAIWRGRAAEMMPGVIIAALFCAVLLALWWMHRPLPIRSYGVMLMLAFAAGIAWATREARRRGLESEVVLDLAFFVLVGSIVGARLVHVLLELDHYRADPGAIFLQWGSGLSFHGGLLGGTTTGLLFARFRGIAFWTLADIAAPSTALGYAIARIGCFLRGCCYGAPTSLPWAYRFPGERAYDLAHLTPADLTPASHPTQLYALAASLIIFGALLWLRGRLHVRGQLFLAYLVMYSAVRWGIEILRRGYTAQPITEGAWLTQAQVAGIAIFVVSWTGIWILARRQARAASHEQADLRPQTRRARERRTSG